MDVTLGYDLNTCLLRLSSDQSSLCQAPLPAGNSSMHVTPSLTFSFCFPFSVSSLCFFFLVLFFLLHLFFLSISWSLSSLPSFRSVSGPWRSVLLIYSASPCLPSLYLPLCAFSHINSPGPLVLSVSLAVALPEDIRERNQGRGVKGQMEMNERHKAVDCRHTRATNPCSQNVRAFKPFTHFLDVAYYYFFHFRPDLNFQMSVC